MKLKKQNIFYLLLLVVAFYTNHIIGNEIRHNPTEVCNEHGHKHEEVSHDSTKICDEDCEKKSKLAVKYVCVLNLQKIKILMILV